MPECLITFTRYTLFDIIKQGKKTVIGVSFPYFLVLQLNPVWVFLPCGLHGFALRRQLKLQLPISAQGFHRVSLLVISFLSMIIQAANV